MDIPLIKLSGSLLLTQIFFSINLNSRTLVKHGIVEALFLIFEISLDEYLPVPPEEFSGATTCYPIAQ